MRSQFLRTSFQPEQEDQQSIEAIQKARREYREEMEHLQDKQFKQIQDEIDQKKLTQEGVHATQSDVLSRQGPQKITDKLEVRDRNLVVTSTVEPVMGPAEGQSEESGATSMTTPSEVARCQALR